VSVPVPLSVAGTLFVTVAVPAGRAACLQ